MYIINYPDISNVGDLLNKDMLKELFGIKVLKGGPTTCNLFAIGSGLNSILPSCASMLKYKKYRKLLNKPRYIWGSGFISYPKPDMLDNTDIYSSDDLYICSLRGQLSLKIMEKLLGRTLDVPLGDGGLLASRWVGDVPKKYKIGIIPHMNEQGSDIINKLSDYYGDDCTVIDIRNRDLKDAVRKIAECEYILSSSLHGLIIADSYHIPNRHVLFYSFGEKASGDSFKYEDYYSSYGLKDDPLDLRFAESFPSTDDIRRNYRITPEMVENKIDEIYKAFPKHLHASFASVLICFASRLRFYLRSFLKR